MRFVIQRVTEASVTIDGEISGKIGKGYLVLIGVADTDTKEIADKMIRKMIGLRIFEDEQGKTNLSLDAVGGELLLISQFTLYADASKGNRPSYINALKESEARILNDIFNDELKKLGIKVETGIFREDMIVSITNIGPTTIIIEKKGDKNE